MSGVACLLNTLKGPNSQLEGNKNPALCTKGITSVLPLPFPSQDKWEGWVRKGVWHKNQCQTQNSMVKNSSLRYCILLNKKMKVDRTLVKLTKTSKSFECCLEMLHFSTFSFFVTVYYSYTFGLHLIKSDIFKTK